MLNAEKIMMKHHYAFAWILISALKCVVYKMDISFRVLDHLFIKKKKKFIKATTFHLKIEGQGWGKGN